MSNKKNSQRQRLRLKRKASKAILLMMEKNNSTCRKPKPGKDRKTGL
jgi:hypothetical protein